MAFFGIDGPFYRFICRFIDLVKLNFMWLLFFTAYRNDRSVNDSGIQHRIENGR